MLKKRVNFIRILFTFLFICLLIRMFVLQGYNGNDYFKSASEQRYVNTKIGNSRGEIVDRNNIPFTDRSEKMSVVLKPLYLRNNVNGIRKISEILKTDFDTLKKQVDSSDLPIILIADKDQGNQLLNLHSDAFSVVHELQRYDEKSLAKHVLGYLNGVDGNGEAGIELAYESILKNIGDNSIGVVTDARKNLLKGLGYRIVNNTNSNKEMCIKLTLDYHIQKIVEDVMVRNDVKGAVVVEDVNSGDIVAMSSKPDYDQNNVDHFLDSPQKELFNKAVASYNVGSIFKIIDTAKALESGYQPQSDFYCDGLIAVNGREFRCTSFYKGGHGEVDLTKAFALSCNPYFINMGLKLGYVNILEMAKKFGFGEVAGIKDQGVDESGGHLPGINEKYSDGDVANISIGQGDVMATPLQVADLIATVANGGIKNKINIVDSIIDSHGNEVKKIEVKEGRRIIRKETAETIKRLMEEVVTNGTGKNAELDEYGGSAGKTGSAETGQNLNNDSVVQAWFAGYFPRINPKYAISVFVENGRMGGQAAAPIFREIAEGIMQNGY